MHGPPDADHGPGRTAGDLLLHVHHRLGRLRTDPGGYFRLPAGGAAGVRPEPVPAAQRQRPAGRNAAGAIGRQPYSRTGKTCALSPNHANARSDNPDHRQDLVLTEGHQSQGFISDQDMQLAKIQYMETGLHQWPVKREK